MSKKPVNLSCHKSQIERTRRRAIKREMEMCARNMASANNIVSYAIVALSDDGRAFAAWDTGGVMPMWAMPQTVAEVLRADMNSGDIDEDFKRPLIDKSWRGNK